MMRFWNRLTRAGQPDEPAPSIQTTSESLPLTEESTECGGVIINATNVYVTNNHFGDKCPKSPRRLRLLVTGVSVDQKPQRKEKPVFPVTIRTSQRITLSINPTDRFGKTEALDGDAVARVVSGDCQAEILPGNKLRITASDTPGKAVVEVTADAQEGEGKEILTETIEVDMQHDNAVTLGLKVESVEDKPTTPPAPSEAPST